MTTRPTHARLRRRRRLSRLGAAVTALAIALITAACATDNNAATTTTAAPVTTATATTTTTAPTTTVAPTTAGPTYSDVETAIRDVHTRVMTELYKRDERVTPPEAVLPLAEELVTDPMLQRIKENIANHEQIGRFATGGGYDSNITEVRMVDDATAWVFDCSQDLGEVYSADGELLVGADDFFKIVRSVVVLIDGRWKVSDLYVGGDSRCDPNE